MISDDITGTIKRLLNDANLLSNIKSIDMLPSGKNNQTFIVSLSKGDRYIVKKYFKDPSDLRDRQNTEFFFFTYANNVAINFVPGIYASDRLTGATLFEFIDGHSIAKGEVGDIEVRAAINFINALNSNPSRFEATSLPIASEACFTLEQHLHLVDRRVSALHKILNNDLDTNCSLLIQNLSKVWHQLKACTTRKAADYGLDPNLNLPTGDRCISPSDFGFHNAIRESNQIIRFIDFEYAGWDDPAKLVGDFFSQVAVPVPDKYFTDFVESIAHNFHDFQSFKVRAKLLLPIYQIKWCCIVLNIFLPTHLNRRLFSNPLIDIQQLQNEQLLIAQSLLSLLEKKFHELH